MYFLEIVTRQDLKLDLLWIKQKVTSCNTNCVVYLEEDRSHIYLCFSFFKRPSRLVNCHLKQKPIVCFMYKQHRFFCGHTHINNQTGFSLIAYMKTWKLEQKLGNFLKLAWIKIKVPTVKERQSRFVYSKLQKKKVNNIAESSVFTWGW